MLELSVGERLNGRGMLNILNVDDKSSASPYSPAPNKLKYCPFYKSSSSNTIPIFFQITISIVNI